jgi:hypothetical protein
VSSRDPWREYKEYDPDKWRSWSGDKRIEVKVQVKSIIRFVKSIFGKDK